MKKLMKIFLVAVAVVVAQSAMAQSVAAVKSRLALGDNKVAVFCVCKVLIPVAAFS